MNSAARYGVSAFVSATLLFASVAPLAAQAILVDIATDVTDSLSLGDTEPSIAVNPLNPTQLAVVAFSGNWGPSQAAPVWKSDDGGTTWRKVAQIPQPGALMGPADQRIGFDRNGRLIVVELGLRPITDFVYRQTGAADDLLTPGKAYGDDQPQLDIDNSATSLCVDQVYSTWLDFDPGNERSTVSTSSNRGATLTDVGAGDNSDFPNRTTRSAVSSDGEVYVIYKTREGGIDDDFEEAHFRVNRSDDCGASWDGLGVDGVSVHGSEAVETWFTTEFGNPDKGKVGRARSSDAWIAVDPSDGDVYAAYVDRDESNLGQIYIARSLDKGRTWSSTRVTDGKHHSAFPEVAVADNGTVGVLYVDFDDSGQRTLFRHRFARSFDDGGHWTDQLLQSMDPENFDNATDGFLWGDYEGLSAAGTNFYGVFTGRSIGRAKPEFDPIFFRETAQQECWTTAGSAGTVDEINLDDIRLGRRQPPLVLIADGVTPSFASIFFRFEDAVVSLRSNHPTGTASIRYNVTAVNGLLHFNGVQLKVRYSVGRNPEARVVVILKRQAINASTTQESAQVMAILDSQTFPFGDDFQVRTVSERGTFDFDEFAYWVEAILISRLEPAFPPPLVGIPGAPLVGPAISVIQICSVAMID